ncbi:MAG: preprotein translocase subunit SecY [Candidatus Eisenbacteria bacterium]|uniref:Protein translocase subunit SecY n=1 Tax=Eiseniibacteriota bacterium TaxID=2212470 RepID=A0A849SXI0_UNCEI|nr:preprotein translocase subunit SecY [Candidatus Eisenbacteria bacterium]
MLEKLRNMFQIPELRRRLIFTLLMFVAYRLGEHVPTPGVNARALAGVFQSSGSLFGLYDFFVGGAFSRATVFALGIMPYISASIILQLLGAVVPALEKLRKEGEEGQKKITQYTRYGTVIIAVIQSFAYSVFLANLGASQGVAIVPNPGIAFTLSTIITQTAGTILVMWMGEKITEHGIGNGISLIIFLNIVGRLPNSLFAAVDSFRAGTLTVIHIGVVGILAIAVIAAVIFMTQGTRKIPVQYAKRIVGRRMYGGSNTFIPLRVNTAGVIPIIFALSLMSLPTAVAGFVPPGHPLAQLHNWFNPTGWLYNILYGLIIVFFTYFYTAVVLNPNDLAENMRKYGGFIPGVRPGKKTAEYIDRVLSRVTLPGAVFLALIAVIPDLAFSALGLPFLAFGGTSVLIVVGVALDTLQQIESHLLMRHYEGFVKRGRIRGRQRM